MAERGKEDVGKKCGKDDCGNKDGGKKFGGKYGEKERRRIVR